VKGDDLVAGTHGRGIWILDDITPLRDIEWSAKASAERSSAHLFKPRIAYRVRQNTNTDTPIPPDEASGQNPPDGAIINYALASAASGPVTLEVLDAAGTRVRVYSSTDRSEMPDASIAPVPLYWYRAPQELPTTAGMHRFLWDLHYQPLRGGGGGRGGLPIAAVPHDTPPAPNSPWAAPGQYSVKLTVDGKAYIQPLIVKMDPRVTTPAIGLTQQFTLSKQLYDGVLAVQKVQDEIQDLRTRSAKASPRQGSGQAAERTASPDRQALQAFVDKLTALEGQPAANVGGGRGAVADGLDTLSNITGGLNQLLGLLQGADATPTTQLVAAVGQRHAALNKLLARWSALKAEARTLNLAVE
jgi:hypothetical protein